MKIFFDDRIVHLLKPGESFGGRIVVPGSREEIKTIINSFETDLLVREIGLASPDYTRLKRDVKAQFTVVNAAGGMVRNERGDILFIHRRGKWDFPKGKINEELGMRNEKLEVDNCGLQTANCAWRKKEAIREVKEETGLVDVEIIRKLKPTYHVYYEAGKRILKKTWWYEMMAGGEQKLTPQREEDIHFVRWFRKEELDVVRKNTYESLKEMIGE